MGAFSGSEAEQPLAQPRHQGEPLGISCPLVEAVPANHVLGEGNRVAEVRDLCRIDSMDPGQGRHGLPRQVATRLGESSAAHSPGPMRTTSPSSAGTTK